MLIRHISFLGLTLTNLHTLVSANSSNCSSGEKVLYMIGKTGLGKSSLANYLLGKPTCDECSAKCFVSNESSGLVTTAIDEGSCAYASPAFGVQGNPMLKVIDTPGFDETTDDRFATDFFKDLVESVDQQKCPTGFVFLIEDLEVKKYPDTLQRKIQMLTDSLGPLWPAKSIFVVGRQRTDQNYVQSQCNDEKDRLLQAARDNKITDVDEIKRITTYCKNLLTSSRNEITRMRQLTLNQRHPFVTNFDFDDDKAVYANFLFDIYAKTLENKSVRDCDGKTAQEIQDLNLSTSLFEERLTVMNILPDIRRTKLENEYKKRHEKIRSNPRISNAQRERWLRNQKRILDRGIAQLDKKMNSEIFLLEKCREQFVDLVELIA